MLNQVKRRLQKRTLVLLYHRILRNAEKDPLHLSVSTANFRQHLECLYTNYDVIGLERFAGQAFQYKRSNSRCQVIITFDDGYVDNYTEAFPVLKTTGMTATFYVTSSYIGTERLFWWDEVVALVKELRNITVGGTEYDLSTVRAKRDNLYNVLGSIRRLEVSNRENLLNRLQGGKRMKANSKMRSMKWAEVVALKKNGMNVGAHTMNHPALRQLSRDEVEKEILGGKRVIENYLGTDVVDFSYPYDEDIRPGNFKDEDMYRVVMRSGFRSAVTTFQGYNLPGREMLALKRVHVDNWSGEELKKVLEDVLEK